MHLKDRALSRLLRESKIGIGLTYQGANVQGWIEKGEVVHRDRGYQGAKCKGYSATMRGARGHPIGIRDKLRNLRISRKRSKDERSYAVIKNVFDAGLVKVTTLQIV